MFASLDRARTYLGVPPNRANYYVVRIAPNANAAVVRSLLAGTLSDAEVLTPDEFRHRTRLFWLFDTGAGAALLGSAILGIIVGTIIVAQTLYSSTKDHLKEFATLRAIGSARRYILKVILAQALISAAVGFSIAVSIDLSLVKMTRDAALPIVMSPELSVGLFVLTIADVRDRGRRRHPGRHPHRPRPGIRAMTQTMIEADEIRMALGEGAGRVEALKGINLSLAGGELTLLMGPSGSGKTTLLSVLGCMLSPTSGSVNIRGRAITGLDAEDLAQVRRENIGFVFQSYHLFPTLTAAENVRLSLDVRGDRSRRRA